MALELFRQIENLVAGERPFAQLVQSDEQTNPRGSAAAEPAGARHVIVDCRSELKWPNSGSLEEKPRRLIGERRGTLRLARPPDADIVVQVQRDPEAIETRAEILGAGRNVHSDFFHKAAPVACR